MKSYLIFFLYLIIKLTSSKEEEQKNYKELNIDSSIKCYQKDFINKTLYIFSKNTISGTFTYDIDSLQALNLSYGLSDSKGNIEISFDEGHNENITSWKTKEKYGYFFSIPVKVSDNDKYTVIKILCNNITDINLNVKLVANYTWKISIFVLFFFLFFIAAIFSMCYFGRNCLTKCCNFMEVK